MLSNGKLKAGRPGKEFVGLIVGRLLVVGPHEGRKIKCVCSCGTEKFVNKGALTVGQVASCGCLKREANSERNKAGALHGHSRSNNGKPSPTYVSYRAMIARCTNPKTDSFHNYGGRGVKVCSAWLDSFETFLADMGERPSGLTLDRKDVNGDYEAGNCKWSTDAEQRANCRKALAPKQTK